MGVAPACASGQALESNEISKAMILALALNDHALLRKVYEQVLQISGCVAMCRDLKQIGA